MRAAPGFLMLGASARSLSATFASLGASFSSLLASHCCRSPASYQTARHRPPSDRAGYTVIPHSSSITSPPPRVAVRPALAEMSELRTGLSPVLARPAASWPASTLTASS